MVASRFPQAEHLRAKSLPKLVGALMLVAGVGYMVSGLLSVVSPPLSGMLSPWLLAPFFLGKSAVSLWLLITGAKMRARAAAQAVRQT